MEEKKMTDKEAIVDAISGCIHQMRNEVVVVQDYQAAMDFVTYTLNEDIEIDEVNGGFSFYPAGQFGTTGSGHKVSVWHKVI